MRIGQGQVLTSVVVLTCYLFMVETSRGELLLRWTFDEAVSGDETALNLGAAAGANGIFNGGATRTDNTPGGASPAAADLLLMENGYISAAESSAVDGLDQTTITAWINLQGDPVGNDRIVSLQDASANFNGFSFNINPPAFGDQSADNFRLGMFVGGTEGFAFDFSEDIFGLAGEWIFVATSYDGLDADEFENLVFYLGTEAEEVAEHFFPTTAIGGPIAPVEPGIGFHVGRTDAAPEANTSLEGFIDDVRVYDEILSLEQLEMVRMEGLVAPPPPPEVAGDYNNNGRVEQADLDLVLLNWGAPADGLPADWLNERPMSGIVDQAELDGVLLNWGNMAAPGAQAIPEPGALLLASLALTAMLLTARRWS